MGRDNHPRERQALKLARKKARRGVYPRILIVCEGEKTEPRYFEEIRKEYRLHTANVRVIPSEGTCPRQIVEFSKDIFFDEGKPFDEIYAVFDRDDHRRFNEAVHLAKSLDGKYRNNEDEPVRFNSITSIPCFELWLLLHFQKVSSGINRRTVLKNLKKHLPDYEKGQGNHYDKTKKLLQTAYNNARELAKLKEAEGKDFPCTDVPKLVRRLTTLKD